MSMKTTTDYWFVTEPYVYINIVDKSTLLYNTLDGVIIESDKAEVIALLQEVLLEENCGVMLLKNERFEQPAINNFVQELRKKYMGDILDITLSNGKPVQVLPYINYSNKRNSKCDFTLFENLLQALFEVSIHINHTSNIAKLKAYLQAIPESVAFNIVGDWREVTKGDELLDFLNRRTSPKSIECSYTHIPVLDHHFTNVFSYKISVRFPVNKQQWDESIQLMKGQGLPFGYIFDVTSLGDCQKAEQFIEEYHIEKYQLNPVYTGNNIDFFEENIFLSREDILSTSMSMKDFFSKRSINKNDFGKIQIMSNGDVYANVSHPILGNIETHSVYTIVQKEIREGKSWLRIRNQAPCNTCIYQDICPSPSDYEIAIGRPNLCSVK